MRRTLLILQLLVAGLFPARVCAQNADGHSAAAPAAAHIEHGDKIRVTGVPNFGKINERLYRGAQPHGDGMPELKKLGITTIVDLRGEDRSKAAWEKKQSESLGMRFVNIPVSGWSPPTDAQVAQFLEIFRESPSEKVFVHCRFGDDRTGVFVAAYRMAYDKFLADEALNEMYFFGFSGFWHPAMTSYVREFPNRLATDPPLAPFKTSVE